VGEEVRRDARKGARRRRTARRRRHGITARLFAHVLIPVLAAIGFSSYVVVTRSSAARQAEHIQGGVLPLQRLVVLCAALEFEQNLTALTIEGHELGYNNARESVIFGVDVMTSLQRARLATDAAARLAGYEVPASLDLTTIRRGIDAGKIDDVTEQSLYLALNKVVAQVADTKLRQLDLATLDVPGSAPLHKMLETLTQTKNALGFASAQLTDLANVYRASKSGTPSALVTLGADSAGYDEAANELRGSHDQLVATTWRRMQADPEVRAYQGAIAASKAGQGAPQTLDGSYDVARLSTDFAGGFHVERTIGATVSPQADAVGRAAGNLASSDRLQYLEVLLAALVLVLGIIGATVASARSISRPLRRLADHARAISAGQIHLDPLQPDGTRETSVVGAALNDLVSNLRLLDAKAQALAGCDLSNPVLAQPLPGDLGQALEASVLVLSGSIEERHRLQLRLAHQATHDGLTGVHNRAAAIVALQQALARARRLGRPAAVLFLDLDGFKRANDSYGHETGDRVLCEVARRLLATVRHADLVARLGGDEFLVLAEDLASTDEPVALARRLSEAVNTPIALGSLRVKVGVSIGITMAVDPDSNPLELLAQADQALYRAKQQGGSAIVVYDETLQQELRDRADVEIALNRALARGDDELMLYWQPIVETGSGRPLGVEALIRWNRPGHGLVGPDQFIGIAEASDLIIDLDRWVMQRAIAMLAAWQAQPDLAHLTVAINVSGRHLLNGDVPAHLEAALAGSGVQPDRLTIELTETVLLTDLEGAASQLDAVRALGVRVAVDDFGTGYTSLAHLRYLPMDILKIDRSFVSQLPARRDRDLARMLTDLGHSFGVRIVAEGVETDAQLSTLRQIGCDELQGYLIARPMPSSQLTGWLNELMLSTAGARR
jgi:diguanylate cyclase (GGDEF)-like protein